MTFGRSRVKPSSRYVLLVDGTVIHKANGDRASSHSSTHAVCEVQGGSPLQRRFNRDTINVARCARHVVARVGHAWCRYHCAIALKREPDRVFHAMVRLVFRGRHPAGAQRGKHVADRIESVIIRCIHLSIFGPQGVFVS